MAKFVPTALPEEVYEEDATGGVAAIYDDIKATFQTPLVNMIFRRLAIDERALAWCWENAKPLVQSGAIGSAGERLVDGLFVEGVPCVAENVLKQADIAAEQWKVVRATIDSYNRANPRNVTTLGVLNALKSRAPVNPLSNPPEPITTEAAAVALPSMVPLDAMEPGVSANVQTLMRHREPDTTFSVPSMYRHLANWPGVLEISVQLLEPMLADGRIPRAAAALTASAMTIGEEIASAGPLSPAPAPYSDAGILIDQVIASFSTNIPELIVVGHVLRQVFAETAT
ncbi:MAG: hypothetical protein CMM48_02000 [Rhodospirillaceae bacterium]|nr:hypothetical protein [Rhodospirillaceae bacterium]